MDALDAGYLLVFDSFSYMWILYLASRQKRHIFHLLTCGVPPLNAINSDEKTFDKVYPKNDPYPVGHARSRHAERSVTVMAVEFQLHHH
jgi:hypothetical protein